jgi:membrane protein required for colicin V production
MIGPLSFLDAFFLVLAVISGLLAMYRGFAREILSIVSWAVAAIATVYFIFKQEALAQNLAQQMNVNLMVVKVAAGGVVFLITLIIVHLLTSWISDIILDSGVGIIDRILGLAFGIARAFLIVLVVYTAYTKFVHTKEDDQFPWVRTAIVTKFLKPSSEALHATFLKYVPSSLSPPAEREQSG